MKKFLLLFCALALVGCSGRDYATGTIVDIQLFGAGERSICTALFSVGDVETTTYLTRVSPLNPDHAFPKCAGLRAGDRVPVVLSTEWTYIVWSAM